MGKPLTAGDQVVCRLYNSMDRKSYGETWTGTIKQIDPSHTTGQTPTPYLVSRQADRLGIWLKRCEIKRRVRS
jgi:hypothetical protein